MGTDSFMLMSQRQNNSTLYPLRGLGSTAHFILTRVAKSFKHLSPSSFYIPLWFTYRTVKRVGLGGHIAHWLCSLMARCFHYPLISALFVSFAPFFSEKEHTHWTWPSLLVLVARSEVNQECETDRVIRCSASYRSWRLNGPKAEVRPSAPFSSNEWRSRHRS